MTTLQRQPDRPLGALRRPGLPKARPKDAIPRPERRAVTRADLSLALAPIPRWRRKFVVSLFGLDALTALVAAWFAASLLDAGIGVTMLISATLLWSALVWALGGDEPDLLASQFAAGRLILVALLIAVAPAGLVAVVNGSMTALVAVPLATVGSVLVRLAGSEFLQRARAAGHCRHRVLVVASERDACGIVAQMDAQQDLAMHLVGVCLVDGARPMPLLRRGLPIFGPDLGTPAAAVAARADMALLVASSFVTPEYIRAEAGELHECGVPVLLSWPTDATSPDEYVAPTVMFTTHGHVTVPGAQRLIKDVLDRGAAALLLIALSPLLLVIALTVRATSSGPALFRQSRVGRGGRTFTMYKFRTMRTGAEAEVASLEAHNEAPGALLFKMKQDPRVTRVGARLRQHSLDELPQLLNVVRGEMSLVGPRPALPYEVARYPGTAWRRLIVRPGMTGLWQISGRADIPSEEGIQLDVHYVDNWSLRTDTRILIKTFRVVFSGFGGY